VQSAEERANVAETGCSRLRKGRFSIASERAIAAPLPPVMQRHNRTLWRVARGILGDDGKAGPRWTARRSDQTDWAAL
jgi:hypothetical protein